MAKRLKVYEARIGFYDVVVAAPNQTAALKAFGVHANLFADGAARVTTDPQAVRAALSAPGEPVRLAIDMREIKKAIGPRAAQTMREASARPANKRPAPPDRTALDAAAKALRAFDADAKRQVRQIADEREALDARDLQLKNGLAARRRLLAKKLADARAAFERAKTPR
jgi:hypothetical protein